MAFYSVRRYRMRKRNRDYNYTAVFDKEVLGEESIEDKIRGDKKLKYKVKTYVCGKYQEVEIFPIYKRSTAVRLEKKNSSRVAQEKLNKKRSQKQLVRMINTNFVEGDLFIDLTFDDDNMPQTVEDAKKEVVNYINRIKRFRKKNGLEEVKYIYIVEFTSTDKKGNTVPARAHCHMVMNKMDRDEAEKLWGKGRANTDRLQPDENGCVGKGMYMAKFIQIKGKRKWVPSKNLKKPIVHESVTKLSRRRAEKLALDPNSWKEIFEKLYKNKYKFNDCTRYISDFTGGCYLYARMVRRE